jgi:hypothetical protein
MRKSVHETQIGITHAGKARMGRHWALPGGKAENVIVTPAGQNEASKLNKLVDKE